MDEIRQGGRRFCSRFESESSSMTSPTARRRRRGKRALSGRLDVPAAPGRVHRVSKTRCVFTPMEPSGAMANLRIRL